MRPNGVGAPGGTKQVRKRNAFNDKEGIQREKCRPESASEGLLPEVAAAGTSGSIFLFFNGTNLCVERVSADW